MAEAPPSDHWRNRMNAQVIWIMNEIFKMYCEGYQFSIQKLKDLGDKLNDECLFHFSSSFSSWQTLKGAKVVDKKELFKALRENSNRTFTTRIIFMEMIHSKDRPGTFIYYTVFKNVFILINRII